MASEQKQRYLQDMKRQRGYVLDFHRIMVAADLDWVKAYDPFAAATYTSQRGLDRKTKELLQTVVLAALRSDVDQLLTVVKPEDMPGLLQAHNTLKDRVLRMVYGTAGVLFIIAMMAGMVGLYLKLRDAFG